MSILTLSSVSIYKTKIQNMDCINSILNSKELKHLTENNNYNGCKLFYELITRDGSHENKIFTYDTSTNITNSNNLTDFKILKNEVFDELTTEMTKNAEVHWKNLNYYNDVTPKIYKIWFGITKGNHFLDYHRQMKSAKMTVICYLQNKKGTGNIVFRNPMEPILNFCPTPSDFEYEFEVENGDILVFPSYLYHKTTPPDPNILRIILAADLNEFGRLQEPNL